MVKQVDYINDMYVYIESLDSFISQFPENEIPVFLDEVDTYENGKIKYTSRTSNTAEYEMSYEDTIDDESKRIDVKYHLYYDQYDYYKIVLTIDVKSELLGFTTTDNTYEIEIFVTDDSNPIDRVSIRETDYPINKSITFRVINDISAMVYYEYEELKYEEIIQMSYNNIAGYINAQGDAISQEYTSYDKEEAYSMSDGLVWIEDSYGVVPISLYDNWKKIYYREDGELTKIKISKIILDDNSEVIISDEQYSDSYSKIWKQDFVYYKNGIVTVINDYYVVSQRSSSNLTSNITRSDLYSTTLGNINSINLDYYSDLEPNIYFDIEPFTYGESPEKTVKTQQQVYDDAMRILQIAEVVYSSSYCYYDSCIDRYMVGDLESDYYDLDSVYVYYPASTKKVYLYAIYAGDYEFTAKNPYDYTKDDVTINP